MIINTSRRPRESPIRHHGVIAISNTPVPPVCQQIMAMTNAPGHVVRWSRALTQDCTWVAERKLIMVNTL
jgi:hypothetical protein